MYSTDTCKLIIGTALDKSENGIVTFVDNYDYFDKSEYDFANSAIIVGTFSVNEGDELIIIQRGLEDGDDKYCFGIIENSYTDNLTDPSLNDDFENIPIKSKKGNSKLFIDEKTISLSTINSRLVIDGEKFEVDIPDTILKLNSGSWGIIGSRNERVTSSITGGEKQLHLFNKQKILMESSEFNFRINDGNFLITGSKDETYSGDNEVDKYESINSFLLKARTMDFLSQGSGINFNAGHMGIKIGSSKNSGYEPSSGPDEAFHVDALDGHIKFETGKGDIELIARNLELGNSINIRCGSSIHPTSSGLEMDSKSLKLYLNTAFEGISSSLVFDTGGSAELNSFEDIDINSETGNINISATMDVIIEAMVNAKLEALKLDLIAETNMKIEASMIKLTGKSTLDLSGSGMIKAGSKTVAPTGSGPFCALPNCLFTGATHSGDTAT